MVNSLRTGPKVAPSLLRVKGMYYIYIWSITIVYKFEKFNSNLSDY